VGFRQILTELFTRQDSANKFIVQENTDGTISFGVTDSANLKTPNGAQLSSDASGNPNAISNLKGTAPLKFDPATGDVQAGVALRTTVLTDPGQLPGLALWLDAQQPVYTAAYATQCAKLGDQVSIWPDGSGNAVTTTPSATKPTFDPTGINGYPGIQFNTNSYLTTSGFLSAAFTNNITVFVVAKATAAIAANSYMIGGFTPNVYMGLTTGGAALDVTAQGTAGAGWAGPYPVPATEGIFSFTVGPNTGIVFANKAGGSGANSSSSTDIYALTSGIAPAFANNAWTVGAVGGTAPWPGLIGEVIVYNAMLTTDQIHQVYEYLSNKWGYNTKKTVICGGNSLTSGTGSTSGATQLVSVTGDNYPSYLLAALGTANYYVRTDAYPGRMIYQLIKESPFFSDTRCTRGGANQIYIAWEVTNSFAIQNLSVSGAIAQYKRWCNARRLVGFKIIAVTCLPRGDAIYAGFANDAAVFNAWIKANWQSFADGFVDVTSDSRLTNPNNATYFNVDKIHLTSPGYQIVANLMAPVVTSLG
jgi:hypothetical protein